MPGMAGATEPGPAGFGLPGVCVVAGLARPPRGPGRGARVPRGAPGGVSGAVCGDGIWGFSGWPVPRLARVSNDHGPMIAFLLVR
jgi:hypothetical protein